MSFGLQTQGLQQAIKAVQAADRALDRYVLAAARKASSFAEATVKAQTPKRNARDPKNRSTGARPGRTRASGKRPPAGTLRRGVKGFARVEQGDPVAGVKAGTKRSYYARIVHEGRKRGRHGPAGGNPFVERPAARLAPVARRLFEDALDQVADDINRRTR